VQEIDSYSDLRISGVNPSRDIGIAEMSKPSHLADGALDGSLHAPRGPIGMDVSDDYSPTQVAYHYDGPGLLAPNIGTLQIFALSPRVVNGSYEVDVTIYTISNSYDVGPSRLLANRPSLSLMMGSDSVESPSVAENEYSTSVSPHANSRGINDLTGPVAVPHSGTETNVLTSSSLSAAAASPSVALMSSTGTGSVIAATARPAPFLLDRLAIHPSEQIDVLPPWAVPGSAPSATFVATQLADAAAMAGRFQFMTSGHAAGASHSFASAADVPTRKTSLAAIPNLAVVEQALVSVVSEIEVLGKQLTHWFDDVRLTPMVVAVTAAVAGAGAVYYVRRRGGDEADVLNDDASSSWLFARLQTVPR
jgi:hypothetical protein